MLVLQLEILLKLAVNHLFYLVKFMLVEVDGWSLLSIKLLQVFCQNYVKITITC